MTDAQRCLLDRIKATLPPDDPHVYGYVDTNQIRWEILIQLLETLLDE